MGRGELPLFNGRNKSDLCAHIGITNYSLAKLGTYGFRFAFGNTYSNTHAKSDTNAEFESLTSGKLDAFSFDKLRTYGFAFGPAFARGYGGRGNTITDSGTYG